MINDQFKTRGSLTLALTDPSGRVKRTFETNRVVDTGLSHIVARLRDNSTPVMSWMAIGSSSADDDGAQETLKSELARVYVSSVNAVSVNKPVDALEYVAQFGPGVGTGEVREAGIFNSQEGGVMQCRSVFGVITKDAGDSLTIIWKLVAL